MKHAFKADDSGKWKTPTGQAYDVKTLQNGDKMPKGYVDNLEKALKKAKPKAAPIQPAQQSIVTESE